MVCGATWVAFCGSPSVSNSVSVTWQPGFALLCASSATLAPSMTLMPSAALAPVFAPANASLTPEHFALPSPAGSAGVLVVSAATSLPVESIWTTGLMLRLPAPAVEVPEPAPLELSVDFEPHALSASVAAATSTTAACNLRRCIHTSEKVRPRPGREASAHADTG
jgi:hypothetical protein